MKEHKLIYAFTVAAALVTSAAAQVTKSGDVYKLRVSYQKGQVIHFNTVSGVENKSASAPGSASTPTVSIPITLVVLDKKKDNATLKLTMGAIKFGGQVMQPESSTVFSLDNRNRGAGDHRQNIGVSLPERSVRIGSTWEDSQAFNIGGTTSAMHGTYRFAGLKTINGKVVAVITYQLRGFAEGTGTMTMLAKDGTLFSNDTKLNMTGGGRSLTRIFSKMTRS